MNSEELRRSHRYTDFLPISISVRNNDDGSQTAGPFSARIIDVSNHGACLLLNQVMMNSYHIFHSTREDKQADLVLKLNLQSEPEPVEIMAKPIWLNAAKIDDLKVFKMGVDFLDKIDTDLLHAINKLVTEHD